MKINIINVVDVAYIIICKYVINLGYVFYWCLKIKCLITNVLFFSIVPPKSYDTKILDYINNVDNTFTGHHRSTSDHYVGENY